MTRSKSHMDLAAFEAMLEACGADRERWPAGLRQGADALLAENSGARGLLREARALDRLLDRASTEAGGGNAALIARILAEAESGRAPAPTRGPESNVVRLPVRRPAVPAQPAVAAATLRQRAGRWQIAAVLALALLTGVAVGTLDQLQGPVGGLNAIVGLESDAGASVALLGIDELPSLADEDNL